LTGTLVFNPGEALQRVEVQIFDDTRVESAETFFIDIRGVSGNGFNGTQTARGTETITDNDTVAPVLPKLTITNGSAREPSRGMK
jgi:hypothetical protein